MRLMKFDYLIVGCGLYGIICARELTNSGFKCLIIDRREHIGGNCYTQNIDGINVHKYGAHIFHTSNIDIWNYINKYGKFNNYINRPKLIYDDKLYSLPINLFSLYQIYGCKTPKDAKEQIEKVRIKNGNPSNLEEWILDKVGKDIYEIFIKGYTIKQWNRDPKNLPISTIKRLPIRFNFNDNYFEDLYQGIPIGGYATLFKNLLQDIDVWLGVDYIKRREYLNNICDRIIYSGSIDEFFAYRYGRLEYRTVYFEDSKIDIEDYQGNAVINYSNMEIPYTRIIEHKHFEFLENSKTIITKEFPEEWSIGKERMYPIEDIQNYNLFDRYNRLCEREKNIIFGGRLGDYKYYDMDKTIMQALSTINKEIYDRKK